MSYASNLMGDSSGREASHGQGIDAGQSWRTEPPIPASRQDELRTRLSIPVDIEKGIYPFRDFKLNRDDIEWLLASLDGGRGPIDWEDPADRDRKGLDLRGVDLRGVDLRSLPLARLVAGLSGSHWLKSSEQQREWAAGHFEGANLYMSRDVWALVIPIALIGG